MIQCFYNAQKYGFYSFGDTSGDKELEIYAYIDMVLKTILILKVYSIPHLVKSDGSVTKRILTISGDNGHL